MLQQTPNPKKERKMFYSVSTISCSQDKLDEYIELREMMIEPILKSAPGFRSRLLLRNRQTGELLLVIGWDSDESASAYRESAGHDELRDRTRALLNGARPQTVDFDVLLE